MESRDLSGKKVMLRNPSASQCEQKFPLVLYSPSNLVLSCGLMQTVHPSTNGLSGGRVIVSVFAVNSNSDSGNGQPSINKEPSCSSGQPSSTSGRPDWHDWLAGWTRSVALER